MNERKTIVFDPNNLTISPDQHRQNEYNEAIIKNAPAPGVIANLIRNAVGSASKKRGIPRLAFTENPVMADHYAGLFKLKRGLIPDTIIKQIRVNNLLVAAILRARGNVLSMFGHLRKDRFDIGMEVDIRDQFKDHIKPEELIKIQERMDEFTKILINCGHTEGLEDKEKTTLSDFLDISTRNGLSFGKFATEVIYSDYQGKKKFHRFRVADAGTIAPTINRAEVNGNAAEALRRGSIKLLESIQGVKIDLHHLEQYKYDWIQVIQGFPRQAFTSEEMIIYNLYPSSDIEHNGYPVTPLDTVITSVTTHSSIEVYNKLYFQNGKAAKGMLVVKSDEIDQSVIEDIKQQYNASINNVENSFRVPIFGVSKDDQVDWIMTQPNKKDGEFEYLFDQTTRNILAAFNMSPDELPGFTHLSRGSNQQTMSESSNEYKLIAARDTGIRPLILKIQDFFNEKLFPIIDPELAQLCYISLSGFDSETKEKESQRLSTDMSIHMNYDEIMHETDKKLVGMSMGGDIPMNERYQAILDKYKNTSDIISYFHDSPAAMVDPLLKYKRDQFFFQHVQQLAQINPDAAMAFYATREDSLDILKMLLGVYIKEIDE